MATESLVSRLMSFGLDKDEAEIYTFLSASGPTPARVIARRFDLNRMKAYRILKVLEDRELVQKVMGRPVKFIVTPPQKVIERQLDNLRHTLTDLEKNKEETLREWEKLSKGAEQVTKEPKFRIFQGRQQVFEILFQMYEHTYETIRLVTTTSDLARLSLWGLDDKLKSLNKQGKKIQILTQVDSASWKEVKPYSDFTEIRHITLQTPIRFAIIDDVEALTTVAMDDSMSMTTNTDTGLWTDASSYVAAMKIFFDALWSLAPDAESIIQSIKTGEPAPEIRTYTTQEEYTYNFRAMIGKASHSIDIIARNTSVLPITIKELEILTTKGVAIRLLTRLDDKAASNISILADSPIIVSENAAVTDLDLLAVDNKEVLLNVPHDKIQKRAVSSNIPAFISIMRQVFKDYWDFGKPLHDKMRFIETQKKTEFIAQKIKEKFEETGWIADAPGIIEGISSKTYTFDILIESPSNNRFCVDLVTDGSLYNKIIEKSNIVSDLASNSCFLASLIPFQTSELRLAELYRISIIYSNTEEGLISSVLTAIIK